MEIKVGKPVVNEGKLVVSPQGFQMSSHYKIQGTLQSVSELCHLVFEMPEEGGTCFRECWCTLLPYCHLPSEPVTTAAQPSADAACLLILGRQ